MKSNYYSRIIALIIITILPQIAICLSCKNKVEINKGDAKVIIDGSINTPLYFCSAYKNIPNKKYFSDFRIKDFGKTPIEYIIPEEACNNRFFISCNGSFTYFEIKPGQKINIEVKYNKFNFSGDNLAINKYLNNWVEKHILSFDNALKISNIRRNLFANKLNPIKSTINTQEGIKRYKSLEKVCLRELKKAKIKDKEFLRKQKIFIKYLPCQMLFADCKSLTYRNEHIPVEFKEFIEQYRFNDSDLLMHAEVDNILQDYFYVLDQVINLQTVIPHQMYQRAQLLENIELQEYYVLKELNYLILCKAAFLLDDIADITKILISSEEGKKQWKDIEVKISELVKRNMAGQDAFNFSYKDINGKDIKLSDFKGKYLFIDFWATWCGPCKAQFPYLKILEDDLHDKNIEFIAFSLNKQRDKEEWKKFVIDNKLKGYHIISDNEFKDSMVKFYNVNSIPRFILIDPNGKIISADCRPPSDIGFRNYLKNILN